MNKIILTVLLINGLFIGSIAQESGTFIDERDGHEYKWVKFGEQTWMVENLAFLPDVGPPSVGSDSIPLCYVFDYQNSSKSEANTNTNYFAYGVLYNWEAAKSACPSGWHLPSDSAWSVLKDYLVSEGFGFGGNGENIAKSLASDSGWRSSKKAGTIGHDQAKNNLAGFTALPSGYCNDNVGFDGLGGYTMFWSSSEKDESHTWIRLLGYLFDTFFRNHQTKSTGLSVRCIKNI